MLRNPAINKTDIFSLLYLYLKLIVENDIVHFKAINHVLKCVTHFNCFSQLIKFKTYAPAFRHGI